MPRRCPHSNAVSVDSSTAPKSEHRQRTKPAAMHTDVSVSLRCPRQGDHAARTVTFVLHRDSSTEPPPAVHIVCWINSVSPSTAVFCIEIHFFFRY